MKRRIISVLLALVLALSLVPTTALASQPDAAPEQPQTQADGAQQNGDTPQPAPAADGEESVQPEEQDTPDQPEGEENAPAAPEAETTDAPTQPADDDQAPQIAEPQPLLPADGGQDMPSVQIGSSADAHRHCVCGASHETVGDHTVENLGAEAWTGVEYLSDIKTSGYYYLTKNITLRSGSSYGSFQWKLPANINVVLCLNGYSISRDGTSDKIGVISVTSDSTLTITDCQDSGKITCTANNTGILVTGGGTLNLYGGKITGNKCGVKISADGTFHMYGGSISGNGDTNQIGCYGVDNDGTFNLYGGSISDNTANSGAAVRIGSPASFTMYGGAIANNTGSYSGVYLTKTDSAFTMSGGSITGNATTYKGGGGVYVASGTFTMSGGSITGNTTANDGGGVNVKLGAFTMTGGIITGNNADEKGGGVYVYDKNVTIKISGTPQIYGNVEKGTRNAAGLYEDGEISNLYLDRQGNDDKGAIISITDGGLQDGAAIGVTINVSSVIATVMFAVGEYPYVVRESDLQYFFSDENHKIEYNDEYAGTYSLSMSPDPAPHTHYLCGRVCTCPANSKETAKTEFTEWTNDAAQAQYGADASAAACLPQSGSYYLTADVTLPDKTTWQPTGAVSLCLNGHTITGVDGKSTITVDEITLNLSDCTGKGKVTHSVTTVTGSSLGHKGETAVTVGHGVQVNSGAFNLYGGSITGNSIRESENNGSGGGVHVASGSFTMYGGSISGNAANGSGSGVYVAADSAFTLYGGSIKDNKELITDSFGIETLAQNGGGVSCAGTFTMTGGVISGNAADKNGNGVYVAENAEFTMSGGTIAENAGAEENAEQNGGGVYNEGTFLLNDGTIRKNKALAGGGVYNKGAFTMSGGSICGNQAYNTGAFGTAYGGGVYNQKTFKMSGGSITDNLAEGNANCRGGGVCNWRYDQTDGVFEVSGKVTITGNTNTTHNYGTNTPMESNVFLASTDKPIVIGNAGLNSASRIGIAQPNSAATIVAVTNVTNAVTANCFTSDSSTYGKYYIAPQNEIWLSTSAPHTHPLCGDTCQHQPAHNETIFVHKLTSSDDGFMIDGKAPAQNTEGTALILPAGEYYLAGSITLKQGIQIEGDVTLCLNGYTIAQSGAYDVFTVPQGASLTLTDCGTTGTVTHSNSTGRGVYNEGTFTMYGGSITKNAATNYGGGVYNAGTFHLRGGSITGNTAENGAGGVCNVYFGGVMTISGSVKITGNTTKGSADNLYLPQGKTITIDGPLDTSTLIGVTLEPLPTTAPIAIATGASTADIARFFPDTVNADKYVFYLDGTTLKLKLNHTHDWSYTASGAAITARCGAANCPTPEGGSVTITPPSNLTYNGQDKAATVTGSFTNGTPKPTVITYRKNGETLSGAPRNAGEYTASITVNGAVATLTYIIAKAAPQAADFTFTAPADLTYNGQRHEASVAVNTNVDGMGQITKIRYYNADGEEVEPINAGVYRVKIDVAEGDNYTAAAKLSPADSSWCMQIRPDPSTPVVTLSGDMTYTGSQLKPAVTVTLNGRTLTENVDYTVTYGANINAGENAGTVTVTKAAAQSDNYAFTTVQQQFTIAPKEVTVSGITALDKIYDGNTTATLNYDGVTFTGKLEEDTLTVNASGAFADKNVSRNKTVTLTGLTLSGASANNYCLAASQQTTASASITAREVTITDVTAAQRPYQAGKLDVTVSGGVVNGKIGNDDVSADPTNASGVMADANAGEAKPVTVKGYTLTGADAHNYTLKEQPQNVTVTITKAPQTITAAGRTVIKNGVPVDITHWASALGAVAYRLENAPAGVTLSGSMLTVSPETTVPTFTLKVIAAATANYAAAETTITVTVTVTSKSDAGVSITGLPAAITYGETLTLTAARTCPDDTNGRWTWTSSDPTVLAVSANGSTATVTAKKAAATGAVITVTYSSDSYDGTFTTAAITVVPKPVTVTGVTAQSRVYDGTAAVTLTGGTVVGKVGNDDVTVDLTGASGAMADANAGVNKPVAVTGVSLSGADRDNYALSAQPTGVTVTITPRPLTGASITLGGEDPVYNGQPQTRPVSAVTLDGLTLTPDTDYTVSYRDNTAAGTATVIITGTGNYTETAEQTFTIRKASIGKEDVMPDVDVKQEPAAEGDAVTVTVTGVTAVTNGKQQTYLIDLKALLKDSIGDLTFEDLTVTLTGGYYTGGASVTADGLLTLPINAVDSTATGSIGSVQLTVTSANYETFTLTVNITAENPRPEDVRPTPPADDDHNWVGVIRRYPAAVPAAAEQADVTSARTFDPGVTLYMALTLLSTAGTALLTGKRKEH